MPKTMIGKKPVVQKELSIDHTFDRNGALVVSPSALLTSRGFMDQIAAAVKLAHYQERMRASKKQR